MSKDEVIKVLLIDDDELQFSILRKFLKKTKKQKFEIEWAKNSQEAMPSIEQRSHDVYLVDYYLGDARGTTIIQKATEMGCHAPMILLTSSEEKDVDMEAMGVGAIDYLIKENVSAVSLERSIRYALEQKNIQKQLKVGHKQLEETLNELITLNLQNQEENVKRKQAEEDSAKQEGILEAVIKNMGDGVIGINGKGEFILFNPMAQKILGMGPIQAPIKEWVKKYGFYYRDGTTPYTEKDLPLALAIEGKESDQEEMFICNESQKQGIYISCTTSPITDKEGHGLGGVALIRDITPRKFAESALHESFQTIKRHQNQINLELEQARDTQKAILPVQFPEIPNTKIASKYAPMEQIGGDFYDVFPLTEGCYGIMIADVTGHGIPAALLSFMVSNAFKNSSRGGALSTKWTLDLTNEILEGDMPDGKFSTLFYAIYDAEEKTLLYTSAGHPPALVIRSATKEIFQLETSGIAVGLFPNEIANYEEEKFQLEAGDRVFFCTDAIIEVSNGKEELLGYPGVEAFIKGNLDLPIDILLEKLYEFGEAFSEYQGFDDDITLICLEIDS